MSQGAVADLSSAVWMAKYEALDRCIADQIIVDAVASRIGKVDKFVALLSHCCIISIRVVVRGYML